MRICMMRHGQTVSNTHKIFLGHMDEGISAIGVRQARLCAPDAMSYKPDAIYCSPLKRAKQTAMIVNLRHVPIIEDERIIERDLGALTGMPYGNIDWRKLWQMDGYRSIPQLEPLDKMIERVGDFLYEVINKSRYRCALVVSHEGVLKSAYAYLNGFPQSGSLADIVTHNTSITVYER